MNINLIDIIVVFCIGLIVILYYTKPLYQNIQNSPISELSPLTNVPFIHPMYNDFDGRKYDYKTMKDPLTPPYKRDDEYYPINMINTRGNPTQFKKFGTLIDKTSENKDKYKFLNLVGRKKYLGSNWHDYYAVSNTDDQQSMKFDLPDLHKEMSTDDTIFIKELNKTYTLQVDRNLEFYYDPFMI